MATVARLPARRGTSALGSEGPAASFPDEQVFDPRRLLGALLRRKLMIGGLMAAGLLLAFFYVNQLTPLYAARVSLLIEGAKQNIVNIEKVAQGLTPDFYTNETQAAVLRSRDIAGKVVDKLKLMDSPLFNRELAAPRASTWDVVVAAVRAWLGPDLLPTEPEIDPWAGYSAAEKQAAIREMVIDEFQAGLTVTPSQRALLIEVEYVSPDPEMAARLANATAEVYIQDQLRSKGTVTQNASRWLAQRAGELRERLIDSERRLERFRRQTGIADDRGVNLLREQIAKINTDLVGARTRRSEAEARYRQVQKLLKSGGDIETAAAVLDSALIQRLREQEAQVLRKIAELRTQLRPKHPQMMLVRNELTDLRAKISAEVGKIAANLGNELEIARVRESNLAAALKDLEARIEEQNEAAVALRSLQTEVQANRQLYDTVLARFKETDVVDENLQQADAKIISRATPPAWPFFPQKRVMFAIALFFSAALGIGIAIILELLDSGFRTPQQLEDMTGLPAIGSLPRLTGSQRNMAPHRATTRNPNSVFGEAVRTIRTALMLTGTEAPPKSIMITSAVSGEGKTSLALSLSALVARSGQRAIVIDCDLRRASLHQALGVPNETGLSNYLSGQVPLSDVIEVDPATGLHFITAGGRSPHPTDLLGSQQMYALLNQLCTTYDMVVLDTPPLLAVSDALVLVRAVDRVVFLTRWEKTRRESMLAAVKQVVDAGANIAGLVLSRVDLRKQRRYGYGYSGGNAGYYYAENHKYNSD